MIDSTQTNLEDLGQYIVSCIDEGLVVSSVTHGELCLEIGRDYLHDFLIFLRDDSKCLFKQLADVCGVDYPERAERFDVVYHLLSLKHNHRVRVKITTNEDTPVRTVSDIYSAANWAEREVWDMYGVMFDGHPDHRRILTDYGFDGHPQRKDFPLTGFVEVRYDEQEKRVVYEPVSLKQDFRVFDNLSPWDGMTDVQLPGDEKAVTQEHGCEPVNPSAGIKGAK